MLIYWPEAFGNELNFVGYNRAVKQLFNSARCLFTDNPKIADARLYCNIPYHHNPAELKQHGLPLIVYTMFESTRMPGSWSRFLNKHADSIIVPTQFCKDVFRLSGVKKPIKVSTLGVDAKEFKYIEPAEHVGFNFLWQGHHYDPEGRKGSGIAERAFKELKMEGSIPDAKLILKYRPHQNFPISINNLEAEPDIIHISETITREEMDRLLSITDCCINPSRGEGFGYIPLEQMAAGLPVIATNWSFPYANDFIGVPYNLERSPTKWCYKHIALTGIGLEYNFGKSFKVHHYPKCMQRVSNGCVEVGSGGKERWVKRSLKKTIWNWLADLHQKSGLYRDLRRRWRFELMFENTGKDATVDIYYIKRAMLNVYNNINSYKSVGREISNRALELYSTDRVRCELVAAFDELKLDGVI